MKPTIIGVGKVEPIKPTVIPTAERLAAKPIHPTSITPSNIVETPVKILGSPTAIKGVIKESQDQKAARLKEALPDIDPVIIGRTVSMYDLDLTDISTIGVSLQERYWDLVTQFTAMIESPVIADSSRHIQRMTTIFQEIVEAPEESGLFFKVDTMWELYEKQKAEIRQLYDILKNSIPVIRNVYISLMELTSIYKMLELDVKATTALLLYIEQKGGYDPNVIQLRKLSLMETIAAIQNGDTVRDSAVTGISSLIEKIAGTILTKVPAWVENVTLRLRVSKTKTDAYQFRTELNSIMSKLK